MVETEVFDVTIAKGYDLLKIQEWLAFFSNKSKLYTLFLTNTALCIIDFS